MGPDEDRFDTGAGEVEPGMNFISADFDLVMVNRVNERLYAKSMVALLGKKCYREFEKRDEPCPHCPGRRALATGEAHEAETQGLRDDGTRFAARIRALPVMGPDNRPTGFIEVVEDITEQKRAEGLARIDADLRSTLSSLQDVRKVLQETLGAALQVEGIDCGCVFLLDHASGEPLLVAQRNLSPECVQALASLAVETGAERGMRTRDGWPAQVAGAAGAPRDLALVPILHRGQPVAAIVSGTSTYPDIPPTLRAGLHNLGATAGNAISRIWAELSRGDAVADLEAVITHAPVAAWTLDTTGRVTMWNKAAERLFGWNRSEVLNHPSPFLVTGRMVEPFPFAEPGSHETSLVAKDGRLVEVRLVVTAFRDVVGGTSTTIVMAEDLTLRKRLAEMERKLATLEHSAVAGAQTEQFPLPQDVALAGRAPTRVLIVDAHEPRGSELACILSSLGYEAVTCGSVHDASAGIAAGRAEGRPFALAIVDVITPDGSSGLDQKAALRALGLETPVILSSDSHIRGHEHHGFAAAIRRPYDEGAVQRAVREALHTIDGGEG